jgi:hypothetical protein
MTKELFGERRSRLEEEFFTKYNQELLKKIREKGEREERKSALSQVSGITNEGVLNKMVALDLCNETLVALSLVPLVSVAWADGSIDDKERKAVLAGAEEAGLRKGDLSYRLLENWLEYQPQPDLLGTWKDYVAGLCENLEPEERGALREELLGRARTVAAAAGGFLGMGKKVSAEEEKVLEDLASAFPA